MHHSLSKADVLKLHHSSDTVILTHRKHGLGYTVALYGTEGLGKSLIGSNEFDRSEEGKLIVELFDSFMTRKLR